jgi:ketosteroid isomerase-like protein
MNAESNEALDVAKSFIAAFTRRDGETLSSVLHDNVILESPYPLVKGENMPGSKRCQGASVHAHMRNMPNVLGSLQFKNVVWRITNDGLALFQADGDATLPNGRPYQNHYLMLFQVTGGKIVRWHEYYSPVIAARANEIPLDSIP